MTPTRTTAADVASLEVGETWYLDMTTGEWSQDPPQQVTGRQWGKVAALSENHHHIRHRTRDRERRSRTGEPEGAAGGKGSGTSSEMMTLRIRTAFERLSLHDEVAGRVGAVSRGLLCSGRVGASRRA